MVQGRKSLPENEKRDYVMNLHLTPEEGDMLFDIAEKVGLSRSEFIRGIIHVHWHQAILGERMTPNKVTECMAKGVAYGHVNKRKRMAAKNSEVRTESGSNNDSAKG